MGAIGRSLSLSKHSRAGRWHGTRHGGREQSPESPFECHLVGSWGLGASELGGERSWRQGETLLGQWASG